VISERERGGRNWNRNSCYVPVWAAEEADETSLRLIYPWRTLCNNGLTRWHLCSFICSTEMEQGLFITFDLLKAQKETAFSFSFDQQKSCAERCDLMLPVPPPPSTYLTQIFFCGCSSFSGGCVQQHEPPTVCISRCNRCSTSTYCIIQCKLQSILTCISEVQAASLGGIHRIHLLLRSLNDDTKIQNKNQRYIMLTFSELIPIRYSLCSVL
jgi:hypothetical protein